MPTPSLCPRAEGGQSTRGEMWIHVPQKRRELGDTPQCGEHDSIGGAAADQGPPRWLALGLKRDLSIEGGQSFTNLADKFVTIREVISEIRDPDSIRLLEFITYTIEEPSRESLSKVDKFAKATGDFPCLSDVDRKLIALTYTLEALVNGTTNLRDVPPLIQTVRVKRLPEKELPGWGSNVANLDEWEALEKETEEISNPNSKILPLKDLNMNIIPQPGEGPKKREVKHKGKTVVEGVDVSQGQCDSDEWTPVVSRKTRTRRATRDAALAEQETQQDQQADKAGDVIVDTSHPSSVACITGDYAMQNAILQMGLRLLAPGGMQIRQLKGGSGNAMLATQ
ncbi:RNA-binding NOB1-like protein [Cardamine amara subsp. amara]|uniref:RNA-binding NOB1-like protein n=1 Tax=Cardamine amara subsp. amara TaxID=228776 RepID=A0ABD1A0I9_CARAN